MPLWLSVLLSTPPPGESQGKGSGHDNLGCCVLGKLGKSANQKYFPKTQALDPGNLEVSSGIFINLHKTGSHLSTPCLWEIPPRGLGLSVEAALELIQAPSCLLPWQHSSVLCIVTGMLGFANKVLCKGLHVFGRNNSAFFFTRITLGAVRDLASHFPWLGLRPWAFLEGTNWQLFIFLFPNTPSPPSSCPLPLQKREWVFPYFELW